MHTLNLSRQSLLILLVSLSGLTAGCSNTDPEDGAENQPPVDDRLSRIEELLEKRHSEDLMDADNQMLELQSEIRQLRGEIEDQQHRIDKLSQELEQVKQSQPAQEDSLEPEPYR